MNYRRLARAFAFQTIYAQSFHTEGAQEGMESALKGDAKQFAEQIIAGVCEEQSILDEALQEFSPKRKMERFPKVELTILRMAAWEKILINILMLFFII